MPAATVGRIHKQAVDSLLEIFDEVTGSRQSPCVVELCAGSGWGKTRVLQAFYEQLVDRQTPGAKYWPPGLVVGADELQEDPAVWHQSRRYLLPPRRQIKGTVDPAWLWLVVPSGGHLLSSDTGVARAELSTQLDFHAEVRRGVRKQSRVRGALKGARQGFLGEVSGETIDELAGRVAESLIGTAVPFVWAARTIITGSHAGWRQSSLQKSHDEVVQLLSEQRTIRDLAKLVELVGTDASSNDAPTVVLVADDLQDASEEAIRLLVQLLIAQQHQGSEKRRFPLMIVTCVRSERAAHDDLPLARWRRFLGGQRLSPVLPIALGPSCLRRVERSHSLLNSRWQSAHAAATETALDVAVLDENEAREFFVSLGVEPLFETEAFQAAIQNATGSSGASPALLMNYLQRAIEADRNPLRDSKISVNELDAWPSRLDEVAEERFRQLDENTRSVVEVAAHLGSQFFPSTLEIPQLDVVRAVDTAVQQGVLVRDTTDPSPVLDQACSFRDDWVHEWILASEHPDDKQDLITRLTGQAFANLIRSGASMAVGDPYLTGDWEPPDDFACQHIAGYAEEDLPDVLVAEPILYWYARVRRSAAGTRDRDAERQLSRAIHELAETELKGKVETAGFLLLAAAANPAPISESVMDIADHLFVRIQEPLSSGEFQIFRWHIRNRTRRQSEPMACAVTRLLASLPLGSSDSQLQTMLGLFGPRADGEVAQWAREAMVFGSPQLRHKASTHALALAKSRITDGEPVPPAGAMLAELAADLATDSKEHRSKVFETLIRIASSGSDTHHSYAAEKAARLVDGDPERGQRAFEVLLKIANTGTGVPHSKSAQAAAELVGDDSDRRERALEALLAIAEAGTDAAHSGAAQRAAGLVHGNHPQRDRVLEALLDIAKAGSEIPHSRAAQKAADLANGDSVWRERALTELLRMAESGTGTAHSHAATKAADIAVGRTQQGKAAKALQAIAIGEYDSSSYYTRTRLIALCDAQPELVPDIINSLTAISQATEDEKLQEQAASLTLEIQLSSYDVSRKGERFEKLIQLGKRTTALSNGLAAQEAADLAESPHEQHEAYSVLMAIAQAGSEPHHHYAAQKAAEVAKTAGQKEDAYKRLLELAETGADALSTHSAIAASSLARAPTRRNDILQALLRIAESGTDEHHGLAGQSASRLAESTEHRRRVYKALMVIASAGTKAHNSVAAQFAAGLSETTAERNQCFDRLLDIARSGDGVNESRAAQAAEVVADTEDQRDDLFEVALAIAEQGDPAEGHTSYAAELAGRLASSDDQTIRAMEVMLDVARANQMPGSSYVAQSACKVARTSEGLQQVFDVLVELAHSGTDTEHAFSAATAASLVLDGRLDAPPTSTKRLAKLLLNLATAGERKGHMCAALAALRLASSNGDQVDRARAEKRLKVLETTRSESATDECT